MLSDEELAYLAWLTESRFEGWGAIVDLGPWLGGSVCALADGLRRSERSQKIVALDNFVWRRTYMEAVHAADLPDHSDFRFLFDRYTAAFAPWIDARTVDLRHGHWDSGPIEILFVDAAKDWQLMNNIIAGFGDALLPERSLVVFQDYQHWACHFLPLAVESRSDLWEPLHSVTDGTTATFRIRRPIVGPGGMAPDLGRAGFPYAVGHPLLRSLVDRHHGPCRANYLGVLLRFVALEGDREQIDALRDEILETPDTERLQRLMPEIEDTAQEDAAQGWELRAEGRIDEALAIAQAGLERHPGDAYLRALRIWCLLSQGRGDEADREADALVEALPTAAHAWFNRAMLHVENERWQAAVADAERGRSLETAEGDSPEYLHVMGHARRALGDGPAALDTYRRLGRVSPGWSKPPLWEAWCLHELDRPEEAVEAITRALSLDPEDEEAMALRDRLLEPAADPELVSRGWTLRDAGRDEEALALAQTGLASHADDPHLRLLELWCLFGVGRSGEARQRADELLTTCPDFAAGWLNSALLHGEAEDWDAALADAERGRSLSDGPDAPREYLQVVGHAARARRETDPALAAYRELAARQSESPFPLLWQGWTLLEAGRTDEARRAARAALAVAPDSAEANDLIEAADGVDAAVRAAQRREAEERRRAEDEARRRRAAAEQEAIARARQIAREAEERAEAEARRVEAQRNEALGRGWSLREAGRPRDGLALADEALAALPEDGPLRVLRLWCLFDLGERERAKAEAERLVQDAPDFVAGRLNRALLELEQGEWDTAEREAEHARALAGAGSVPEHYHQVVGHARRGRGDLIGALSIFDELARIRGDWAKAHVWRGWCLFDLDRLGDAAGAARDALAADPDDAEARRLQTTVSDALAQAERSDTGRSEP